MEMIKLRNNLEDKKGETSYLFGVFSENGLYFYYVDIAAGSYFFILKFLE
jgi:hypothetical protein